MRTHQRRQRKKQCVLHFSPKHSHTKCSCPCFFVSTRVRPRRVCLSLVRAPFALFRCFSAADTVRQNRRRRRPPTTSASESPFGVFILSPPPTSHPYTHARAKPRRAITVYAGDGGTSRSHRLAHTLRMHIPSTAVRRRLCVLTIAPKILSHSSATCK